MYHAVYIMPQKINAFYFQSTCEGFHIAWIAAYLLRMKQFLLHRLREFVDARNSLFRIEALTRVNAGTSQYGNQFKMLA